VAGSTISFLFTNSVDHSFYFSPTFRIISLKSSNQTLFICHKLNAYKSRTVKVEFVLFLYFLLGAALHAFLLPKTVSLLQLNKIHCYLF